jgi:hypothetical protein
VTADSHAKCIMLDGTEFPISRSKKKLIKAYFGNHYATAQNVVKLSK